MVLFYFWLFGGYYHLKASNPLIRSNFPITTPDNIGPIRNLNIIAISTSASKLHLLFVRLNLRIRKSVTPFRNTQGNRQKRF